MARRVPLLTGALLAALVTALLAVGAVTAAVRSPAATRTVGNPADPTIVDGSAARRLDAARERWTRHGTADYRFRVRLSCFCPQQAPGVITVRHGRPVHPAARYVPYATVPRLFAVVDRAIASRAHLLRVRYDRATGYPRQITIDPNVMIADEELAITADRLRRLGPRSPGA